MIKTKKNSAFKICIGLLILHLRWINKHKICFIFTIYEIITSLIITVTRLLSLWIHVKKHIAFVLNKTTSVLVYLDTRTEGISNTNSIKDLERMVYYIRLM